MLVLFMTIPGLSLFYSGMVREKNVLTTIMQVFSITCLITFLWLAFGYRYVPPATQRSR
jgi:Amt family ammonium transporter